MPGLVPGIHVLGSHISMSMQSKAWMGGGGPAMTDVRDGLRAKPLVQDLPENPALDGLVGLRRIVPPPAVALHFLRRRDEAVGDFAEIGVGVVQAENQAAGADPA